MLSDPYASVTAYRANAGKTDAADDALILADLTAISRYLDGRLGRFFGRDAANVSRYYDVEANTRWLMVDDMAVAPTTIKVRSSSSVAWADITALTVSTDYDLAPLNAPLQPEPQPYNRIELARGYFATGQRVQVTGKFGWPAVPAAIQQACCELTRIWRLESPRATSRIDEMGEAMNTSREAQGIINKVLDQYRRGAGMLV